MSLSHILSKKLSCTCVRPNDLLFDKISPFTTIGTIRLKTFFEVTIGIKTDLNLTALYPSGITRHYKFRFRRYKK